MRPTTKSMLFPGLFVTFLVALACMCAYMFERGNRASTEQAQLDRVAQEVHQKRLEAEQRRLTRHFAYAQMEAPDETSPVRLASKTKTKPDEYARAHSSRASVNAQYAAVYAAHPADNREQRKSSDALNRWRLLKGRP